MKKILLFFTFNLFVVCIHAQTASCQNINVILDETGNFTITADDINSGSSIGELSIDISSFTCDNIGANNVTLTATDSGNPGNTDTCVGVVTVFQPEEPEAINCWDDYQFDSSSCSWQNYGYEPTEPYLECWQSATFNNDICDWDITGEYPEEPEATNCWDDYQFDSSSCSWQNYGYEPSEPYLECWQSATFNNDICDWDITGEYPEEPEATNCWDDYQFDSSSCDWQNYGYEPTEPYLECWETATFNNDTCDWDITGEYPEEPEATNCWDDYQFDSSSCDWQNYGSPIIYYIDADRDTYGSTVTTMLCDLTAPPGYSVNNLDCNDSDANINPGVTEIAGNSIDDDCNSATPDGSLGIDGFNLEKTLIASNPFDNIITIKLPLSYDNSEFNIKIFDLNGRIVFNKNHSSINGKINISNLNRLMQALYLIKITDTEFGNSTIKRLMKR